MMIDPSYLAPVPPSYVGRDLLYLSTLGSILLVVLLALEWIWRLLWSFFEQPSPLRSPATAYRIILLLLLSAALLRIVPDLVLLATWQEISPASREAIAVLDKRLESFTFVPFSLAWLVSYLTGPMLIYQLGRQPLPIHLWPTWQQAKRPLKIGVGVAAISFALTYLR